MTSACEFEDSMGLLPVMLEVVTVVNGQPTLCITGGTLGDTFIDLSTTDPYEIEGFFSMVDEAKARYRSLTA